MRGGLATAYHSLASDSILEWSAQWESALPDSSLTSDRLSDSQIEACAKAYWELSMCNGARRHLGLKTAFVTVGPTAAAKVLFAARPNSLPPWDEPIRRHFRFDGGEASYAAYLGYVREQIKELSVNAAHVGIKPEDIPSAVGRPQSTLPKLVDEYNWVTVTRGFAPVSAEELAEWHRWSEAG